LQRKSKSALPMCTLPLLVRPMPVVAGSVVNGVLYHCDERQQ
jgi:hypothetical protein